MMEAFVAVLAALVVRDALAVATRGAVVMAYRIRYRRARSRAMVLHNSFSWSPDRARRMFAVARVLGLDLWAETPR